MDNKGALEWLQRELNHQKYCLDIEQTKQDEHATKKHQAIIDALEVAVDAVEKQIEVKPLEVRITTKIKDGYCNCGNEVCCDNKYCCECGQKNDWGE